MVGCQHRQFTGRRDGRGMRGFYVEGRGYLFVDRVDEELGMGEWKWG